VSVVYNKDAKLGTAVVSGVELRGARDEPPLHNGEATDAGGRKRDGLTGLIIHWQIRTENISNTEK